MRTSLVGGVRSRDRGFAGSMPRAVLATGVFAWFIGNVASADEPFHWPNGARAAVSLAYDDAMDSQLDNAIPALDRHRLKATFYLSLGRDTVRTRLSEWRAAAANGHELANHTLFHQCSRRKPGREWVTPDNDLDRVSVHQLVEQIRVGNTLLNALDGRVERTFTPPCGDTEAGGQNYLPAIQADFVAIKSGPEGVPASMHTLDPHAVNAISPVEYSGEQLIAIAREAAARGTMANYTFHGIGGEWLPVSKAAHDALLRHLAENRDIYWTDTFLNIMKYVKKEKARSSPSAR